MEFNFKFNMVVELLNALLRYARNSEIEEGFLKINYKKNEEISSWIESVKCDSTKYMDSEIIRIFRIPAFNYIILLKNVINNNIEAVGDFLNFIKVMSKEEYINDIYEALEIDKGDMYNVEYLKDVLLKQYDKELAYDALEMIENAEETLSRIYFIIKRFYERFFSKIEKNISTTLEKKVFQHKEIYNLKTKEYVYGITALDEENIKVYDKINFYVSHFKEAISTFFDSPNNSLNVVYGWQLEYKFDNQSISEKRKSLFKILSDDKRVEILKLISIRPWYGNELAQHLGITTATLSYHVGKLFSMNLITYDVGESNRLYYSINKAKIEELFQAALIDIIG